MKTFETGGYAVCTDPGAFNLVRGQTYELVDVATTGGVTWLNLGPDLGSFDGKRFRPASPIEDPRFIPWTARPEGFGPVEPLGLQGSTIEVELRSGVTMTAPAQKFLWHEMGSGSIARYRVVSKGSPEVAREPETSPIDTLAETVGPVEEAVSEALGDPVYTPRVQDLPDGNPKTRFGIAKPPLSLIPGLARVHLAEAFRDGAQKYGPANWRQDPVTTSTYLNAAERHIVSWQDGEEVAADSGVHHLAHAAACLLILLDAQAAGSLLDDRPTPAPTGELIREKTRPLAA